VRKRIHVGLELCFLQTSGLPLSSSIEGKTEEVGTMKNTGRVLLSIVEHIRLFRLSEVDFDAGSFNVLV
jgi:hypothetical protein